MVKRIARRGTASKSVRQSDWCGLGNWGLHLVLLAVQICHRVWGEMSMQCALVS